jgi:ADP-ribose pyrophosphatase YjhB (NUDIX family)
MHRAGRSVMMLDVSEIDVTGFDTATDTSWMSHEQLEMVRAQVPIVYVEAVPVRVDALGNVTKIGLLLRVAADGSISRLIVSGRVKFGERIRDALLRHCEKDLGPLALPRIPVNPSPFTVAEYFPHPDISGFHDPRQHAVSLVYVVPVDGECQPTQEALDLGWYTPAEAVSPSVITQMTGGQDRLLRLALAHVGQLP